ncbi:hypothetical protein M8C21_027235, partial [Ambrosia artemisiifolia]
LGPSRNSKTYETHILSLIPKTGDVRFPATVTASSHLLLSRNVKISDVNIGTKYRANNKIFVNTFIITHAISEEKHYPLGFPKILQKLKLSLPNQKTCDVRFLATYAIRRSVQYSWLLLVFTLVNASIMSSSYKDMDFVDYLYLLKIPIEEIKLATNNFADENLLTRGTSYQVYKGQLSQQSGDLINIVARKSRQLSIVGNELAVLTDLNHKNIVSVFKWTVDEDETTIINKYEANESLNKHISSPTLTWMQRLRICVGVAHTLGYLHHDAYENYHVIHGNIKSSKILLDHNWEPKLHGFGFAVELRKHELHLTSNYNRSLHHMDPAYEDTRGFNHKSDIFSFGVLLFEVLFGREASIPNNDNWSFAQLARSHYEEGKLDNLIDPDIRKQMNLQSFNIFADIAYHCIMEQRSKRPDMNKIRTRLDRALELQQKHEQSTVVAVEGTTSNHLKVIVTPRPMLQQEI